MWRTTVTAVLAIAAGTAAAAWVAQRWPPPTEPPVREWTRLPNGLQFRVQRVKGAKDVAVVTVYGVGSDNDPPGKNGLAHLAEHLYVTSAAGAAPPRTGDEWADSYGKQCSATTHDTFTCMAAIVGPRRLERELADVAARMSELRIEPSDLDRERPLVLEQIAEQGDPATKSPPASRLARARILELPNEGHSGGLPSDVERITLDDVREFARRSYCPANARIAVAGDVDPDDVAALVTRVFADLPAGEPVPAPPDVEPRPQILRVERDAAPGPDYEPCQRVWIAYPRDRDGYETTAVVEALGAWAPPGKSAAEIRQEGYFLVLPDERAVLVMWTGDERPVEEVTRKFDALVEDFVQHATGHRCAERVRNMMRQYDKAVTELKKHGIEMPARDPSSSWDVAFGLAIPNSPATVIDAVESLTNDDIRRSVATWHVAGRRLVVDHRGWWRRPSSDAATNTPESTASRLPSTSLIPQVRVTLTWDESTQTMHRKVGDQEYAKDDDLQKAIAESHAALAEDGRPDAPVTIDADHGVPWDEVVAVMNVIKRCGIERIEFGMGATPKAKPPK